MVISSFVTGHHLGHRAVRLGVCSAVAVAVGGAVVVGGALVPTAAWTQPAPDAPVEAICVAQTTLVPALFGGGMTGQDTITCTDAAGAPLLAGRSELSGTGAACGDSTTTIKTRWDDGTETVTETTGRVSVDAHTYTATGRVTADSTRFADATVSITGTGIEPSCENPHLPSAAAYLVTFHG